MTYIVIGMFLCDIHWKLRMFSILTLEIEIFFKKLECRFLAESTKIENGTFPYKTVMSEASVKTIRIEDA